MSIFEYNQERHMMQERAVALKMIRQGYTDEQIIALCEISPEEITEYRKSIL
ncbi:hypothetical protein LKD70_04160 [Ruminococcus sp. CLA-AA-H200]|uniref:Transposase n=1 Tax=Ruminococcus turbiniformis TaxID=2881258 RepID=A0ABS8FUJ4_9FIRM|nr:hypothetical protein [Ruminococcus turbiniformis]MCC2253637.1 hypothetical protein [Ruminococcus turbiniformis]